MTAMGEGPNPNAERRAASGAKRASRGTVGKVRHRPLLIFKLRRSVVSVSISVARSVDPGRSSTAGKRCLCYHCRWRKVSGRPGLSAAMSQWMRC